MTDCDKIMERVNKLCDKFDEVRKDIKQYSDNMDRRFEKIENRLEK